VDGDRSMIVNIVGGRLLMW